MTELTSETGWRAGERADELERLVEVAAQRDHAGAVHQRLGQLAGRDLALGTITAPRSPARAAYAAAEAAVLPVDAQITVSAPSRTAADTAQSCRGP